jgi:hypothetical protein
MDILNLINDGDWSTAIKNVQPLFKSLEDGKNLFHYACIRGQSKIIDIFVKLKSNEIFLSDSDGNTGAHLLAINGWNNILLELINDEPNYLKLKNNNDYFIFNTVIKRPIILQLIVKCMEKYKMIEYLNYVRIDNRTFILDIIKIIGNGIENDEKSKIYYDIFKKLAQNDLILWDIPKTNHPLSYAIRKKINSVCKFLITDTDINCDTRDEYEYTPLILSITTGMYDVTKLLLKKDNIDINFSGGEGRFLPLTLCIKMGLFDLIELLLNHKDIQKSYNISDNFLNTPIFYLIRYANVNKEQIVDKKIMKLIKTIIRGSDINHTNLNNETPIQLLVKTGLWEIFSDVLENLTIDLNSYNKYGENVLEYLDDDKTSKFVKIIDKSIKKGFHSEMDEIIDVILPESKQELELEFGVFNADSMHNIAYMMYILNKHTNCTIPMQYPNIEKHMWDTHIINLSYTDFRGRDPMLSTITFYNVDFFTIAPHILSWRNKDMNYINSDINFYLKRAINETVRFVIIKLSLSPQIGFLHSNIVLYDKKNNTVTRFEPYGDWDLADSYQLDKKILDIFKDTLKNETFKYIRPNDYLDKTKFQSSSLGDDPNYKNFGDPEGYCLAWSYWFAELKMLNPDINEQQLVKNAFDKILRLSNSNINPILQHIRGYARHLDKEKNKIFDAIGITKQLHYKLNHNNNNIIALSKYVNKYVMRKLNNKNA